MTNRDKRFEKIILAKATEYPYEWIKNFLEYCGYRGEQEASSHITFRRKSCLSITIVIHHNRVHQVYVRRMIKTLKELKII